MRFDTFSAVLAVAAAVTAGGACARDPGGPGTLLTGRLVDGETGRPVSRSTVWIHAFDDVAGRQESLRPSAGSDFALRIEGQEIRLRVADLSNTYELHQETLSARDGAIDVDVRLRPTHWVRLHGTVLWRDGARLRPLREGDANVRSAAVQAGRVGLAPDAAGTYSVKVPRELLKVLTINTNRAAYPKEIDLSGFAGDAFEQDVVLDH